MSFWLLQFAKNGAELVQRFEIESSVGKLDFEDPTI